MFHIVFCMLH